MHESANGSESEPPKSAAKLGKKLDVHLWGLAWDRYALAGAVLDQFTHDSAVKHKNVVMEIAVTAAAQSRTLLLGVLYDELQRCA